MILYLDTSALVKLYVEEVDSEKVTTWVGDAYAVATSLIAYVEARAAFARGWQEGVLTGAQLRRVVSKLRRRLGALHGQRDHRGPGSTGRRTWAPASITRLRCHPPGSRLGSQARGVSPGLWLLRRDPQSGGAQRGASRATDSLARTPGSSSNTRQTDSGERGGALNSDPCTLNPVP